MRDLFILLILLLTINFSYAIVEEENKVKSFQDNWYSLNNTLAYSILENLPDYLILHSTQIMTEANKRYNVIWNIFFSIATNLLIRSCFDIGYDSQLVYAMLSLFLIDSFLILFKPITNKDNLVSFIAFLIQISTETATSLYVIKDSFNMIPLFANNYILGLITLIAFPITSYNLTMTLYNSLSNKQLTENIQHPRLELLNKLVKNNTQMHLYSEPNIMSSLENDKYFIKINKWVASHKNDLSLYNIYCINNNHLLDKQIFTENNQMLEKANNYAIATKSKNCRHLKLGLGFIPQSSAETINKEDISELLTQKGHFIIEANKDIENFNIAKDLLTDKHQYIVIINHKSLHYLLIGLQLTVNSSITKIFNKLFWPILFKNIPHNNYVTLSIKFKNTQMLMELIEDIVASFEECNSRTGIYKLQNIINKSI